MEEYVYARHHFFAEQEDEISFRAGERIAVLEKDELYCDGWWQGRNLAGKVGIFPESYTQPAPPSTGPPPAIVPPSSGPADKPQSPAAYLPDNEETLQPRLEDSSHSGIAEVVAPDQTTPRANGKVMRATLADVQQAVEQLGHKNDFDGSRSFSSRGVSTDHETDHDINAGADGRDWHRGAGQKLAEKAKKAVEEQAVQDAAESRVPMRSTALPADVELGDDSGDEGAGPSGGPPSTDGRLHPDASSEEEVARLRRELVELERQLSATLAAQTERDQRLAQLADELALKNVLLEQAEANAAKATKRTELKLREHADRLLSLVEQKDAELMDMRAKFGELLLSRDQHVHALEQAQGALQNATSRAADADKRACERN